MNQPTKIKTETIASMIQTGSNESIRKENNNKSKADDTSIKTADFDDNIETRIDEEDDDIQTLKTIQDKITEEDDDDKSSSSSRLSSYTTTTTAKELENKVKQLQQELLKKKQEAEKLKQSLKSKEKLKLKQQKEDLLKKINSYDTMIDDIKIKLDKKLSQKPKSPSPPPVKRREVSNTGSSQIKAKKLSSPSESPSPSQPILKQQVKLDKEFEKDDEDDQIKTVIDHTIASITTHIEQVKTKESKSSSSSITLSSVSSSTSSSRSSSTSSSPKKSIQSKERASVIPALSHEEKYDDDFESTQNESAKKKIELQEDEKEENDEEINKSTVSEISEDIMNQSIESEKSFNKTPSKKEDQHEIEESSSSTDTQILALARSKAESPTKVVVDDKKEKEEKSTKIVDKLVDSVILNETIEQMISIRERKKQKIADDQAKEHAKEVEEQDKLKIYIPSIDLDYDDSIDHKTKSSLMRSEELKEKIIKMKVPYKKDKVEYLVDQAIDLYFWPKLECNLPLKLEENVETNISLCEFFKPILDEESRESELTFKRLLLDLVGELMYDMNLEKYEVPKSVSQYFPGVKKTSKKQYFKMCVKGPNRVNETKELVKNKLNNLLKLNEDLKQNSNSSKKSKWRWQKRLDLVDNLLDNEMREQEFDWANYEVEEYEAKLMVSNTIFDILLKDTIECFEKNFLKKLSNISTQLI